MRKLLALLTAASFALAVVPTFAAEEKKADAPKTEKKADAPKTEKPKADAAKADKPKPDAAKPKADKPKADPEARFKMLDKDSDGAISEAEWLGKLEGEKATKQKELFGKRDTNKDGKMSLEEFKGPAKKPKAAK